MPAQYYQPGFTAQIDTAVMVAPSSEAYQAKFTVSRSIETGPDTASVSIYGLAPARRAQMALQWQSLGRSLMTIAAGYGGIMTPLFGGDVRSIRANQRSGADRIVTVTADDAGDAITEAPMHLHTGGSTARQLIQAALLAWTQYGTPIVAHASVEQVLATKAAQSTIDMFGSYIGKARDLVDEAARRLGARWWIRNGQLFMALGALPIPGLAVVPFAMSEPVREGQDIELQAFFDPLIMPGVAVQITDLTGVFQARVQECTHNGNLRGGSPWTTQIRARLIGG